MEAAGLRPEFPQIEVFAYPEMPWAASLVGIAERFAELFPGSVGAAGSCRQPAQDGSGTPSSMGAVDPPPGAGTQHAIEDDALERLLAVERLHAEERGRLIGMEQGRTVGRGEMAKQLQEERERLVAQAAALATSFAGERDQSLHRLEQESVKLALAIAARILRREAQIDPLLLTGAVRVALGQLAQSTIVRLRVPVVDLPLWEEALARMPGLPLHPQVVGEPGMELGECRMETELGSANLGLWAQLKEIERGFFDRVGERSTSLEEQGEFAAQAFPVTAAAEESSR